MEVSILEIIKYLVPSSLVVAIWSYFWNNRLSIIKESPRIFVKQITSIEDFKRLNGGFKCDDSFLFEIYSIRNEETKQENTITDIKRIDVGNLNIEKNMLYINIINKNMDGAEIKMLDYTGRYIRLSEWEYNYICESQRVGVFIDFYCRPRKILVIYKGNRLEYDIYSTSGAVKTKLKKEKRFFINK